MKIYIDKTTFWKDLSLNERHENAKVNLCLKQLIDTNKIAITDNANQADAICVSCFGKLKPISKPTIMIYWENRPQYCCMYNTCIIGNIENAKNSVFFPLFNLHNQYSEFSKRKNCYEFRNKKIISFCIKNNSSNWRNMLLKKIPESRAINLCGCKNKLDEISKYVFTFCAENSYAPAYITEKLIDGICAGCIPIYKGGNFKKYLPEINSDKVIDLSTDENKKINEFLNYTDDEIKERFCLPPFTSGNSYESMLLRLQNDVAEKIINVFNL